MEYRVTINASSEYGSNLYGADNKNLPILSKRMRKDLSQMREGSVLSVNLSGVEMIDLGFLQELDKQVGKRPPGIAVVFEDTEPHASIRALAYSLSDKRSIVIALNDGLLTIHGAPFALDSRSGFLEAYSLVCGSTEGITSKSLLSQAEGTGLSKSNASNRLNFLWKAGLLSRTKDLREYRYKAIFQGYPFTVDQKKMVWSKPRF